MNHYSFWLIVWTPYVDTDSKDFKKAWFYHIFFFGLAQFWINFTHTLKFICGSYNPQYLSEFGYRVFNKVTKVDEPMAWVPILSESYPYMKRRCGHRHMQREDTRRR
jgi:hypothetical protein